MQLATGSQWFVQFILQLLCELEQVDETLHGATALQRPKLSSF